MLVNQAVETGECDDCSLYQDGKFASTGMTFLVVLSRLPSFLACWIACLDTLSE